MKSINELFNKYAELARVAHFIVSGAEKKALNRIAMNLTDSDPLSALLEGKCEAELDILHKPHQAAMYVRQIKWYDQAIADLLEA